MRATVMYGAGDVRMEDVPDARLIEPTDALVRVTRACVCGGDLWPYKTMEPSETGLHMGHEAIGVVEAVGTDVRTISKGDVVVVPSAYSDGTCAFCHKGLQTSCVHGGFFGTEDVEGTQAEAVRVPLADGTLFALPVGEDDALMPSLLTLSDVMGTGHHAAVAADVGPGKTVAVVGDGAVGLCGVIAAKRLGAERIMLLGSHPDRIALGTEFGATDIVSVRGGRGGRARTRSDRRPRRTLGPGMRRPGGVDRDGAPDRWSRWRSRARRAPAGRLGPRRDRDLLQERHHGRRTRARPRL